MSDPAAWWGEGTYERLAERLAPVHDELVEALEPHDGEEWLDAATGTGEVALRAARAGARVTAFDFSAGMLEKAKERLDGLGLQLDQADARDLPYDDASFDVVASMLRRHLPTRAGAGRRRARSRLQAGRAPRDHGVAPRRGADRGVVAVHRQAAASDRRLGRSGRDRAPPRRALQSSRSSGGRGC